MNYESCMRQARVKIEQAINQFQLDTGHIVTNIEIKRTPPLDTFRIEIIAEGRADQP